MLEVKKKKIFSLVFFFVWSFCSCADTQIDPEFSLEGTWKEVKGDSIFDKSKREALYQIQRIGDVYTARIFSIDNAIEQNFQIRGCKTCYKEPQMLLGFTLLRDLKRNKNGTYSGEFYDVYNRKWFEAKVIPISKTQINIRAYAVFPTFGRNVLWERGEKYHQKILESEPVSLQENKQYYAMELGNIDFIENDLVHLHNVRKVNVKLQSPIYFFSKQGKLLSEGFILKNDEKEITVQIPKTMELKNSFPVIFFDRSLDWSVKF